MAIIISAGRGVTRVQTTTPTPSLATINAKMLSEWEASSYAGLSLDGSSLSQLSAFISETATKQTAGNCENYAPFRGSMVKVYVDTAKTHQIVWSFNGFLYGLSESGLSSVSINDVIATF